MGSAIVSRAWQGKWALVTGASSGIGAAIAAELAEAGVNLILTARRGDRLNALAGQLGAAHSIETKTIVADLAQHDARRQIFDLTEGAGLAVDLLVNNAGFGEYSEFVRSDLDRELSMVEVNCTAVVHLTRLFLPNMIARRRGDVMIVSSIAAYQPVPYLATYAATKAFDRLLAEALAEEVRRHGVRVSALCPGSTESEFFDLAGARPKPNEKFQSAQQVAKRGLEGLALGKPWVIPYLAGRLQVFALRFLPRKMISRTTEKMFRPPAGG